MAALGPLELTHSNEWRKSVFVDQCQLRPRASFEFVIKCSFASELCLSLMLINIRTLWVKSGRKQQRFSLIINFQKHKAQGYELYKNLAAGLISGGKKRFLMKMTKAQ